MTYSGSNQPDLDWSQIRETVKLLAVSVAQVEGSMRVGDDSVGVLTASFTTMVDDMAAIHNLLLTLEPSEQRDTAIKYCTATQDKIGASIIAFQFYDRLQQCLSHVSVGLKGLSDIIETPNRLYNPAEWHKFQEEVRNAYTMEAEKVMFDAIHQGKSIEEALHIMAEFNNTTTDEDDVEFF